MQTIIPPVRTITLPAGAGPGEARIVIGPDLPPPLDTYVLASGATYSGAIVFYANDSLPPLDTNYTYIAVVDNGLSAFTETQWGRVYNGAVVENGAGIPDVASILAQGAGTSSVSVDRADSVTLASPSAAVTLNTSSGRLTANPAPNQAFVDVSAAGVDIQAKGAGADILLTAADDILLSADAANTLLQLTASIGLTANAGGITLIALGAIALGSLNNITLSATGTTTSEGDLVGLRNANLNDACSATGSTSSTSYADYPGSPAVTFTKRYAGTALLVTWAPSFFVSASTCGPDFAVAIGGTDYKTHQLPRDLTPNVRLASFGQRRITGIAAGSVTITGRWARIGVGSVQTIISDDWVSLTVQEVAA